MLLYEGAITPVSYTSATDNKQSDRVIVPVTVPEANIKAFDVTAYSADDRLKLADAVIEYVEYRTRLLAQLMTFENWFELAQGQTPVEAFGDLKWRTFKPEQLS